MGYSASAGHGAQYGIAFAAAGIASGLPEAVRVTVYGGNIFAFTVTSFVVFIIPNLVIVAVLRNEHLRRYAWAIWAALLGAASLPTTSLVLQVSFGESPIPQARNLDFLVGFLIYSLSGALAGFLLHPNVESAATRTDL